MTYSSRLVHKGSTLATRGLLIGLQLMIHATYAADCAVSPPPEQGLLDAETAFAAAAHPSLRQAFLDVLADDAWVLAPRPTSARAWYTSRAEPAGGLDWYPEVAVIARSGDLGFTSGPYTASGAAPSFGHFLSVWRRIDCRWRLEFDGGVAHEAMPGGPRIERAAATDVIAASVLPPGDMSAAFQTVAGREGLGAALRTYARDEGFVLLIEGRAPLLLRDAERQVRTRMVKGSWREATRGASADKSLSYVVGALDAGAYVEIWQYDAHTANWGLRLLLLSAP